MEIDVIVIGAGLAGMMAAQAAQAEGAKVLLIDKGSIGRGTNTALANGVFAAPTSDYSSEAYVEDTIQAGRKINDAEYVKLIAQEAPKTMAFFKVMGLDLEERKGQFFVRTPSPDTIPGMVLVKTLARMISGLGKVTVLKNFYVTQLLTEEKTGGVKGFDETGQEMTLRCPGGHPGHRRGRWDLSPERQSKKHHGPGICLGGQGRSVPVGHGIRPVLSFGLE